MILSKGYWQTYKEIPSDAEIPSHQLMLRAGLIHKTGAGIYTYLPMGLRSIKKVENIIREELDKINCFEVTMSVVTPGELWKETGRWDVMGDIMLRFTDRAKRDLCISPTNEETVTDLFRKTVKSYKQLPVTLYQINTKFRDEIRPRFGLMRGREFTMKDAYSFHLSKDCLDSVYDEIYGAYCNIFSRLGLEYIVVEADGGAMASGGAKTHEFQVVANAGEDQLVYCPDSKYAANIEKAQAKKSNPNQINGEVLEKISTPNISSIEEVATFLKVSQNKTLKAMFYSAVIDQVDKNILCFIHGDDELNEIKLKNNFKADHLKLATEENFKQENLVKGFIGPFNINSNLEIIVDESIDTNASFIVGANEPHFHFKGFSFNRDMKNKFKQFDIRNNKEGDLCPISKKPVILKRGIEVGHVFQLGDKYTKSMNVTVLDQNGKSVTPIMGCYGIGVTRTVASAIEQSHDKDGIIWPVAIAPYHVYFGMIAKSEETKNLGLEIYKELAQNNIETVFDDRNLGPGGMFKDADLLGLPVRLLLGERDYNETKLLEIKVRKTGEVHKVLKIDLVKKIKEILSGLK